jgi:DNA-binding GntR family transcriptional regulator
MIRLETERLRDQARRSIYASILSGELPAGEIHSAIAIAGRLGVSATPIREAMLDLANAGLVEAVRNRGFRVLTISDADLDEIVELRMLLEPPGVRRAAEEADREALDALEPVLAACEAAAESGDIAEFLIADREFHLGLLATLGNGRLVELVGRLRDQTRLVGLKSLAVEGKLTASAEEHRAILDAVRGGRGQEAEERMRAHLRHARGLWAGRDEPK